MSNNKDEERVYNLNKELLDLEVKKKAITSGFNEEIKRIKAEIKAILSPEKAGDTDVDELVG